MSFSSCFQHTPRNFPAVPPVPLSPIDCCPVWHVAEKMTVVTWKYLEKSSRWWKKIKSTRNISSINEKPLSFHLFLPKKSLFSDRNITLQGSSICNCLQVKTFPLRQNSTPWHPNPVGERSAGDTMGVGTSNGRLAVGVRSLLKRLLGRPARHSWSPNRQPKELKTHRVDMINLKILTIILSWNEGN